MPSSGPVTCPNCGYENRSSRTFCRKCKINMLEAARQKELKAIVEAAAANPQAAQVELFKAALYSNQVQNQLLAELKSLNGKLGFIVAVVLIGIILQFLAALF